MIWLTSDLHFCHNREFIYKPRGFSTIQEMNEAIVKNFSEVVSWTDQLWILGDLMLNNNVEGMKLARRLPGEIHILIGNHDTASRIEQYKLEPRFKVEGYATVLQHEGYNFYLSHYPTLTTNFDDGKALKKRLLCIAGHTHSKSIFESCGSYNIALDAHNNYPVSIDRVIYDFEHKEEYK